MSTLTLNCWDAFELALYLLGLPLGLGVHAHHLVLQLPDALVEVTQLLEDNLIRELHTENLVRLFSGKVRTFGTSLVFARIVRRRILSSLCPSIGTWLRLCGGRHG